MFDELDVWHRENWNLGKKHMENPVFLQVSGEVAVVVLVAGGWVFSTKSSL